MTEQNTQYVRATGSMPFGPAHYREWRRRQVTRMAITYIAPLVILVLYFQYGLVSLQSESNRVHLGAIAEHQANTLDLFLSERRVNLANLIDHPTFSIPPTSHEMALHLQDLRRASEAFVDLGFFDSAGVQVAYAGPYPSLEKRDYRREDWYIALRDSDDHSIITDVYLGFRNRLHFTIAVSRIVDDRFLVLRATLDPARMYEYMESQQAAGDVTTSLVNSAGVYQLVDSLQGQPLDTCPITVADLDAYGMGTTESDGSPRNYAFRWLRNARWCLIVQSMASSDGWLGRLHPVSLLISGLVILIAVVVIIVRSAKLVEQQKESDQTRAQLEHAAKLASVGELASGIAHEINNPLAVITEEAGLLIDYTDPQFGKSIEENDLRRRLATIQASAFRCRDITRKLLRFVRKSDFDLREHDVHEILEGVIDDLLGPEIQVSNVEIVRDYDQSLPKIITDANQLQQVVLNIVNNARDALGSEPGTIRVSTSRRNQSIIIAVEDTGSGIAPDQIDKLFLPFFTTKEVGKGTGLGLSVSYGIIKGFGGEIEVESTVGKGSKFSLVLPINVKK